MSVTHGFVLGAVGFGNLEPSRLIWPNEASFNSSASLDGLLKTILKKIPWSFLKSLSTRKLGQFICAMNMKDKSSLQRFRFFRELKTPDCRIDQDCNDELG